LLIVDHVGDFPLKQHRALNLQYRWQRDKSNQQEDTDEKVAQELRVIA
jgi:hypothetical protein